MCVLDHDLRCVIFSLALNIIAAANNSVFICRSSRRLDAMRSRRGVRRGAGNEFKGPMF